MQPPVKDLLLAGGEFCSGCQWCWSGRTVPWSWLLRTCKSKSAFHFLELGFPKVDFFSVCFRSLPKLVSSNSVPLTDSGMAWSSKVSNLGLCLNPGNSWIQCGSWRFFLCVFFSHEMKNWCCQKMIVTICLTIYVFLNFTNHLCSWVPTSTSAHAEGSLVSVIFFLFFLASLLGQIPFDKEGILVRNSLIQQKCHFWISELDFSNNLSYLLWSGFQPTSVLNGFSELLTKVLIVVAKDFVTVFPPK